MPLPRDCTGWNNGYINGWKQLLVNSTLTLWWSNHFLGFIFNYNYKVLIKFWANVCAAGYTSLCQQIIIMIQYFFLLNCEPRVYSWLRYDLFDLYDLDSFCNPLYPYFVVKIWLDSVCMTFVSIECLWPLWAWIGL